MWKLFSEILFQTLPTCLLARLARRTPMRSSPRSLIGERSTPSAYRMWHFKEIALQLTPPSPCLLLLIVSASRWRSQFSSQPRRSSAVIRATTDVRVDMSLVLSIGASARALFLKLAIPSLVLKALATLTITSNLTSADKTVFSTRLLTTA